MTHRFSELQLTPEAVAVMKHHGVESLEALAEADVTELQKAFVAAAREGRYSAKYPSLVKVAAWVEQARGLLNRQPEGERDTDLENIPTAVIKRAVTRAEPGSGRPNPHVRLVELRGDRRHFREPAPEANGVVVPAPRTPEETPPAHEELNPVSERTLHQRRRPSPLHKSAAAPVESPPPATEEAPPAGFRTFDDYKKGRVAARPLDRHSLAAGEDRSRRLDEEQEDFEQEQEGKKRMPRWRVRGVQYSDPGRATLGAFVAVAAIVCTAATIFIFIGSQVYFDWPREAVMIPFAAAILFGLGYVFFALGMKCRVCSCHLFYSRHCLKNAKAHRLLGGWPMLAQSLHMLLFRWFRCMYCGTAIRLRRERDR